MKSAKFVRDRVSQTIEHLESRVMLDGEVEAFLQKGDLVIRGDDEANQIVITQPRGGTIRIAGREGTLVNGKESVDLPRISDDLIILMQQDGEDQVAVQGAIDIPDDLQARLGEGQITIEGSVGAVNIRGELNVRTGEEGIATIINNVKVGGDVFIKAGEVSIVAGLATVPDFGSARFDNSLEIDNPYFPLVVGTVWTYEAEVVDDDTGEITTEDIIVEVLPEMRTVAGVRIRVVRDRVFEEGRLIEDTHDFYAQDNNGNVWYFGEDVINYEYDEQGQLLETNQDGSWRAGVDGAQAGIIMEARPRIGHRYYQEWAPGNVLDQAVGVRKGETITVGAGTFSNGFRTEENSVVEPLGLANKVYAPGVGTVAEFDLDIEDDEVVQTTRLISLTLNGEAVSSVVPADGFEGVNARGRVIGGGEIDGETDVRARGPIVVNGSHFDDEVDVRSKDVIVAIDSIFSEDAKFISNDTVSLRRVLGESAIEVKGKLDDLYIRGSEIEELKARFDAGDNVVVVKGSEFGVFDADGGAGSNTFEDQGGNRFGKLRLRRFTRV